MKRLQRGLSVVVAACLAADWTYSGDRAGPCSWHKRYPECGGSRQSPININTSQSLKTTSCSTPIKWLFYDETPTSVSLMNNGHTIQLKPTATNDKRPSLLIGSKIFELAQIHFHWGKNNTDGSEHSVNNTKYSLEMHAVHRLVENGCLVSPPEIVVVAVLFEVSEERNSGLDKFFHHISSVKVAGTEVEIPPFPLADLLPPFTASFRYQGSLTTPPCSEVVTFYIQEQPAKVSADQMGLLRVALNEDCKVLSGNIRPTQPINGRTVDYVRS